MPCLTLLPPRRDTVSNSLPHLARSSHPITLLISREQVEVDDDDDDDDDGRRRVFARRDYLNVCMEGTRERTWRIRNGGLRNAWLEREREEAIPRDSIESDDIRA